MKPAKEPIELDLEKLPPSPPEGSRTKKYDPERDVIPRRLAAKEVRRVLKTANVLGFTGIVGYFTLAIVAPFNYYAGAIVAGVLSLGISYFLYRSIGEKRGLETKYNIDPRE